MDLQVGRSEISNVRRYGPSVFELAMETAMNGTCSLRTPECFYLFYVSFDHETGNNLAILGQN